MRHESRHWRQHAVLVSLFLIATLGPEILEAQPNSTHATNVASSSDLGDFSSAAIYAELKRRGLDPLRPTASKALRRAYVDYDFAAGGGHNLESSDTVASARRLNNAFVQLALTSLVHVRTVRPGARIKYRLAGEDMILALPQLTNNADDTIPIGLYYFWAERAGKATSQPEPFRVISPTVPIDIEEAAQ
jgi:hypothetical protein